ncbi:MAG: hypothetical protein SFY69_08165 [Planctomycetota bacterium]|nr:hypothetical protein [Planctomycetota bacterium]
MNMQDAGRLIAWCAAGLLCPVAVAQVLEPGVAPAEASPARETPPTWRDEAAWTVRFEPSVWFVGIAGDVQLPRAAGAPSNDTTDLADLDLDDTSLVQPLGEITLRKGDWGIGLRGFAFSNDQQASGRAGRIGDLPIADGDRITSSVDVLDLEIEAMYTIAKGVRSPLSGRDGYALRWRVDVLAGVRVFQTDWEVANLDVAFAPPASNVASAEETTAHPLVGVKVSALFLEQFTLDAKIDVGYLPLGDTSSYGVDIFVGGSWQPHRNVGVQIGYRAMFVGVSSGDGVEAYEYDGSLQGLYAGLVLEF